MTRDKASPVCYSTPFRGRGKRRAQNTPGSLRSPGAKHGSTPSGPHVLRSSCPATQGNCRVSIHRRDGAGPAQRHRLPASPHGMRSGRPQRVAPTTCPSPSGPHVLRGSYPATHGNCRVSIHRRDGAGPAQRHRLPASPHGMRSERPQRSPLQRDIPATLRRNPPKDRRAPKESNHA